MRRNSILLIAVILISSKAAMAGICQAWQPGQRVGMLDPKIINEASGLAISRAFPGRLYHINDSGDGPNLYVTKADGSATQTVQVEAFKPKDVEDLSLGSFGAKKNCIFIGDIGDNNEIRPDITVVVVEETPIMPKTVAPLAKLLLKYPDRAHNAEGLAIHPNGDLYILTKEMDQRKKQPLAAQLFRLKKDDLEDPNTTVKILEKVGEFDLPKILNDQEVWGQIVTGFDISPDGQRFLILTYTLILEVQIDLSKEFKPTDKWILGSTYVRVATAGLAQQEAVAYGDGGESLLYDSELGHGANDVPLIRSSCSNADKVLPKPAPLK